MSAALLALLSWLVLLAAFVGHWPAVVFALVLSWLVVRHENDR